MTEPSAYPPHEHLRFAERVLVAARFEVRRLPLARRGGGVLSREVVRSRDAVVILPLLAGATGCDQVVLIRNERFAVGRTLWELPAGTLEAGEDPVVGAGRELIEETGYAAGSITPMTGFFPTPGLCTEWMHLFRAQDLRFVGQDLDETEQIEVEPVPYERALAMIRQGEIQDGKTIAALLYHHTFGRNG